MSKSLKNLFCQLNLGLMNRFSHEIDFKDLRRSAIVFAPHQDDETLGCGGTLIKKIRAGADVKIIFMTDGSRSHSHLISEEKLVSLRTDEAIAAAQILGIKSDHVNFLGFKDCELYQHQESAIEKVIEILRQEKPQEIFIPYYKEPSFVPDHFFTNQIVLAALHKSKIKTTVYEYPIWFWRHWPWTSISGNPREILTVLKVSLISNLSFRLLRHFQHSVYIEDVLYLKQAALEQYKSQMTKLLPDSRWATLRDVSNGEFLDCFLQKYEVFRRYELT